MKTRLSFILAFLSITVFAQFGMGSLNSGNTKPEPVANWTVEVQKVEPNVYDIIFSAVISDHWHVYSISLPENGPMPTQVTYETTEGYILIGDLTELSKTKKEYDDVFEMDVNYYEGTAKLKQRIKLTSGNDLKLSGVMDFQGCKDGACRPGEFFFDVDLKAETVVSAPVEKEKVIATPAVVDEKEIENSDTNLIAENVEEKTVEKEEAVVTAVPETTNDSGNSPDATSKSLFWIILTAFGYGLGSLLTPCVYPIIPLTVSFFTRSSGNKVTAIRNAVFFGLSIALIYSAFGLVVGIFKLDVPALIAQNWIANAIFFVLFVVFALSFFGLFELMLPTSWANKIDSKADKGGLIGSFFMALATVVISFSCTGPISGLVLGSTSKGDILSPVIGMFSYGIAFALPFTILAIFPSYLNKMPKSGGWMNSVKVVFAFVMVAMAMKFLYNATEVLGFSFISREAFIAIWVVLFFLLGLYLLGKIKFSHDSDIPHLSVLRLFFAIAAFSVSVYLFPGLFGADLKAFSSFLPPKSADSFVLNSGALPHASTDQAETFCGDASYADKLHMPAGIKGYYKLEEALACAKENNKPVFVDFTGGVTCSNCKVMDQNVISTAKVSGLLKSDFVSLALYTNDNTKLPEKEWITSAIDGREKTKLGQINKEYQQLNFNTLEIPMYVVLSPEGEVLAGPKNFNDFNQDVDLFLNFLKDGLQAHKKVVKK